MGFIFDLSYETMRHRIILLILLFIIAIVSTGVSNDPFSSNPENQLEVTRPSLKNKIFMKIIMWQHYLKKKMSSLVRQAKATNSLQPLIFLLFVSFVYGIIHAAGPGHGKSITLSYVLSQQPGFVQGILFGNSIALFHGISGIIFVLLIRIILHRGIVENLENITQITQIVSFSLITCLGLGICSKRIYELFKYRNINEEYLPRRQTNHNMNILLPAFVIGGIPCPAVVLVMVFALSMDLIALGVIMGLAISIGMATTITIVVIIAMSGKTAILATIRGKKRLAVVIERWIGIFAGIALVVLGLFFLGANI